MSLESSKKPNGCTFPRVTSALPSEEERGRVLIGTHDGTFHCDEVLACYLLRQLPEYEKAWIIRTRDQELLKECDIVVDVGAEFDPERCRYDHHQRGFEETFASLRPGMKWVMKLSSAGLVYVHYGERILQQLTNLEPDDQFLKVLYGKLYEEFIQEIDAIDNGVSVSDGENRYKITTNLSSRVGYLNPWWNEESTSEGQNERFVKAIELVGTELNDRINFFAKCWWPARSHVAKAIANRHKVHGSGRIIVLESGGVPWKSHLFEIEEEQKIEGQILFVLYTDNRGTWRVQTVPADLTRSFDNRLALMEAWRGLRDDKLASISGVEGAVFVHQSGFIGGCHRYEGALMMAEKSIEEMETKNRTEKIID